LLELSLIRALVFFERSPISINRATGAGFGKQKPDTPGVQRTLENKGVAGSVERFGAYRDPLRCFIRRRVRYLKHATSVVHAGNRVVINLNRVRPEAGPVPCITICAEYDGFGGRIDQGVGPGKVDKVAENAGLGIHSCDTCQHQGKAQDDDVDFGFFHLYDGVFVNVNEGKDTCFLFAI